MNCIRINVEFFNTSLKPLDILILTLIEGYTRERKQFDLTNQQLADMFNVTEKTVRNTLDRLEEKNYINRSTKYIRSRSTGKAVKVRTISLVHLKIDKKFEFSF